MNQPYYKKFIRTEDELRKAIYKNSDFKLDYDFMHMTFIFDGVIKIKAFNLLTRRWLKPSIYYYPIFWGASKDKKFSKVEIEAFKNEIVDAHMKRINHENWLVNFLKVKEAKWFKPKRF